ncbi:MAG: SDR family oxidoreductase [Bacteroidales bacterium]|nr:SDR family oxidoreductase [Bacteroidales bacterium]
MYNPFSLEGKIILVTGASSGIGRAVAIECSRMGAYLIITGRNKKRLDETFSSLEDSGHKQVIADLRIEKDIGTLLSEIDKIDGLVHCAGIVNPVPFQFVTKEKINEIFSINFNSPAILTQNIVNNKLINKGASIVFISSVSGVYCSYVAGSLYSSTKGAINGLIKGMALDLAGKSIRVNSVCPGMIETNILGDGRISEEQLEEDRKKYPLKRYGKPEEVAYAVIYLLSDASKWVTGSNILIDGGYTLL